jgi:hypothetical protein
MKRYQAFKIVSIVVLFIAFVLLEDIQYTVYCARMRSYSSIHVYLEIVLMNTNKILQLNVRRYVNPYGSSLMPCNLPSNNSTVASSVADPDPVGSGPF